MKKNTIIYVVVGVVALIIIALSIYLAVSNNSKSNNRYATKNIKIEKYNESGEVEKVVEIKKRKDINELLEICKNISLEQDETSKYLGIKTDVKIDLQTKNLANYPEYGTKYGKIRIPSLNIDLDLYYGDTLSILRYGVGHSSGSYFPGEGGSIVCMGHNTKGMLRELPQIQNGAQIIIETTYGIYTYEVYETRVVEQTQLDAIQIQRENEILKLFCKISIEEKAKIDEKEQNMWNKKKEDTKSEVERLKDNVSYLEEITNTKKELTKKIEKIDKMINNQEQLKKEYDKRNAKLPNKDKIFSVRQLVNKMEVERQEYIDKIKECNDLLEPKSYVARKEKVNQEYEFLKKLDFKGENQNHDLKELCKLFLQCFRIKIEKTAIKQEIIEYVYELRYFGFLMIDKEKSVKDTESLHEEFEETVQALYKKAKDINAIEEITKDEDINFKIIKKIFDSKMIDLNNMVIKTKVKDEKFIEYYDVNILETTIELQPEKTIKLNKKTKLFV